MSASPRALIIHPSLKQRKERPATEEFSSGTVSAPSEPSISRSPQMCLEEAVQLAHAITGLDVIGAEIVSLNQPKTATYIGGGKIEDFATLIEEKAINLVIVNTALTPVQQRNLEKKMACKVIDRTALILEIFGERAQTKEGKLQVELAALDYQKSRLVRSWTHLERQRGGFGFTGGPGESQIEVDRRLIKERIHAVKQKLSKVLKTRDLHRKIRRDTPYPLVSLVGYTNAGKSSLFNQLTHAGILAQDALFATLDPTIRKISLPSGKEVLLSDTVGFISNLPTELVAAFRATLEEVCEADIILHVRDISHPETEAQKQDVEHILASLLGKESEVPVIEVLNKVDLATEEQRSVPPLEDGRRVQTSALTGEGTQALLEAIEEEIWAYSTTLRRFRISASEGKAISWLYQHGYVVENISKDGFSTLHVRISDADNARFVKYYGTY